MKLSLIVVLLLALPIHASTILFMGDSHSVGPFGWAFDQHLRDQGHSVSTFASCGSIGKWWFTGTITPCGYFARDIQGIKTEAKTHATPLIKTLMADLRPQVVVIELGGNYVKVSPDIVVRNDINTLVSAILDSGARCFWITNPDSRTYRNELPRINSLIHEAVANRCPIFDSHLVTRYPETGGDGVHYWSPAGTPIAKTWAQLAHDAFKASMP